MGGGRGGGLIEPPRVAAVAAARELGRVRSLQVSYLAAASPGALACTVSPLRPHGANGGAGGAAATTRLLSPSGVLLSEAQVAFHST